MEKSPLKRILLLNALSIYGGGEFFVYQFAELLKKKDFEVWVSCRKDNLIYKKCEEAGINLFHVDYPVKGNRKVFRNTLKLRKFIKEKNIQLVHTNTNYDRTAGAFAACLCGIPVITTNHSFHSIEYNPTHWLRNKSLINHFIVDGQCTMDLLIERDNIKSEKITLIHLGIDPETMKRDESLRKKIRSEFEIRDDEIIIGNVARMVEFKGQEYLLRAAAEIIKEKPNVRFMIVGSGKLESYLHEIAKQLNVANKIIFTGFRDDLQAIYSSFDIYAHTSVEGGGETFPYALLYALAQGLACVVTRVGDVPAMVIDGLNGFVVEDKNISAIAEKLNEIISDKSLKEKFGNASYEHLIANFTQDKMVQKIIGVYQKTYSSFR